MTKAEQAYQQQLRDMGCCVCLFVLKIEDSPAEIHHIVENGKRKGEMHVLGLCAIHHRQGVEGHPSRHSVNGCHGGRAAFEKAYGTEYELMEQTDAWLEGREYFPETE